MYHIYTTKKSDNWETPRCYLECLLPFIGDRTINDPFFSTGRVKSIWKSLGKDITHTNSDFFNLEPSDIKEDCIISNIPFSIKNRVFRRLFELDKPFIVLVPIQTIAYIKTQRIIGDKSIQLIIPNVYKGYIDPITGEQTKALPFYSIFVCYKMNLNQDINYI